MDGRIEAHNRRPAAVWSSGGDTYNEISHQIASALDHCVQRVDPKPGEHVLDLATGTGWTSRLVARRGAMVTAVDIAPELIVAAEIRAEQERLDIVYDLGDVQRLPYPDGHFDAVVSTFGVMFANRPEAAASELARVCRKGGRIGLTTWLPDSNVYNMFSVMREYMPPPAAPPAPSPFAWGRRERVLDLLGYHFDVRFEEGITIYQGVGLRARLGTEGAVAEGLHCLPRPIQNRGRHRGTAGVPVVDRATSLMWLQAAVTSPLVLLGARRLVAVAVDIPDDRRLAGDVGARATGPQGRQVVLSDGAVYTVELSIAPW